jgi:hypothetical protein
MVVVLGGEAMELQPELEQMVKVAVVVVLVTMALVDVEELVL